MCVRPLGGEDPLEWGMATHSSILAWRIPWTEKPGGLQSRGSQRSRQVSRGSAGEYQADEQAGVARLSCRVSVR